jgi:hypothetical protein
VQYALFWSPKSIPTVSLAVAFWDTAWRVLLRGAEPVEFFFTAGLLVLFTPKFLRSSGPTNGRPRTGRKYVGSQSRDHFAPRINSGLSGPHYLV